ncbi:MAG: DUF5302 domain-containing protein [Aldersonia sp.]|nr:DUF5302 domain-containing protein [Aldersonia sp.]
MSETSEEQKRKFKEALERKNHQRKSGADHLDGQAKAEQPHGPAGHRREFRRKSG